MAQRSDKNQDEVVLSAQRARARNRRILTILIVIIIVCVAFVLGFLLRGQNSLMTSLGFESLAGNDTADTAATAVSEDPQEALTPRIEEVENLLDSDSLDSFDINAVTPTVLDAIIDGTDDPYACYFDPDRYAVMISETAEEYSGIGVLFSEYNGQAYAVDVFEGSAAQAADVQQGDFVLAIDGDRGHEWTQAEVLAELNRDAGESIVITWRRPDSLEDDGGEIFTTTLPCSQDLVENVETEMDENVGYIQLKQITQNAAELVQEAVNSLASQGAEAYVLDIRDNPGGYLTQAVDTADLFVNSGTLVRIETKSSEESTRTATNTVITDAPLVVLTNGNTASAAEVLAAALQDNQRATLVGQTTLGKGSVQVTRELSFGGALRYTAAYYESPLGHTIDGVGVEPDVQVSLSASDEDNQKDVAIETAASLVAS